MARNIAQRLVGIAVLGAVAAANVGAASKSPAPAGIDFNREIRPILSDNCFACHGPDEKARKAKLRLDLKEDAFKPAKSGELAIVPGDPKKSELVARITTKDEDDVMPPGKSGKKLSPQQIDLLTRWIQQGAVWQEHWAFVPPKQAPVPQLKDKKWARNPIDKFVAARLEKEKLKPTPEADRTTLIRRATLDLTGLPPTPQEVDAFLADKSKDSYEKVVDRLLESPRYGEHMARYWMDAVRYADSHGYHIDSERSIWKYREWVINAFNRNIPFDQFTIEQLAGDLLPEATTEQKIASGYVRCNMTTGEGGAIEEEYKAKYTFDRVETTSMIWMGMTMTCARCHTHKYDPITHKEYYQLYAFFDTLDEPVMDNNKPNPNPFIKLPTKEQAERQAWLKNSITNSEEKLNAPMPELDKAQLAWEDEWHGKLSSGWSALKPETVTSTNGTQFKISEDSAVVVEGPNPEQDIHEITLKLEKGTLAGLRLEVLPHDSTPKKSASRAEDGVFRLSEIEAELIAPAKDDKESKPKKLKFAQAVADMAAEKYEVGLAIDDKPDTGWSTGTNAMTEPHTALFVLGEPLKVDAESELRLRLRYEASKSRRAIAHFRLAAARNEQLVQWLNPPKLDPWKLIGPFKSPGLEVGFTNEYEPERLVDLEKKYPGVREEIRWNTRGDFEDGKANLLVQYLHGLNGVYYLYRELKMPADRKMEVSLRADDLFKFWVNGKLVTQRDAKEKTGEGPVKVTVDLKKGDNKLLIKVVNYQGECSFTFTKDLDERDVLSADVAAILATTKAPAGSQKRKVRDHYRRLNSPDWKALANEVAQWRDEDDRVEKAIPTTLIAKEAQKGTNMTRMLVRGEYDKKGDAVTQGVPAILPPFPSDSPTNRLGLAKWLVSTSHPLTARVTMNRLWQQYFGTGFVKTAEDFGVQGERPSHPDLFDWLAAEFVNTGWDVKRLQRLIVTSSTYRQSSKASQELLAKDPENRLLARGPRFRVDGEVVRDTALAVSGLLVEKPGGKSAKPYEPPGLWEAISFNSSQKYVPEKGEGQYRRSLYTHWKRQSPPPNMLIFDAPTREYCVVKRPRTNTPLQALALMNDPQFVEASRGLAQRMMTEGGGTAEERIVFAFRLATARKPGKDEAKVLREVFKQQLAEYQADNAAAEKLLAVGTFKPYDGLDKIELAAWTTVANMILNLDETITKN